MDWRQLYYGGRDHIKAPLYLPEALNCLRKPRRRLHVSVSGWQTDLFEATLGVLEGNARTRVPSPLNPN